MTQANFTLSPPTSPHLTLPWGKRSARIRLLLTNHGDSAEFRLTANSATNNCRADFYVPGVSGRSVEQVDVSVLADEIMPIQLKITPRYRRIASLYHQNIACVVSAEPLTKVSPTQSTTLNVNIKPLIGPGIMAVAVSILLLIGIWVANDTGIFKSSDTMSVLPIIVKRSLGTPQNQGSIELVDNQMTYEEIFREAGKTYGVDWRMLAAQAYQESTFNPQAIGTIGEYGLMQIGPDTWNEWAPQVGVSDPFDPYSNALVAAAYLKFWQTYFTDLGYTDDYWMFVAYNWGPYNLDYLLNNGGSWDDIPAITRYYSLSIIRAPTTTVVEPPISELLQTTVTIDTTVRDLRLGQVGEK